MGSELPLCQKCTSDEATRLVQEKRPQGIGRLRPQIVLYGENNLDKDVIGEISAKDLKAPVDAVIVVGTDLKIPGMKWLAREFCRKARSRAKGVTIWISKEPPSSRLQHLFDFIVLGDCDEVVSYLE